MPGDLVSQTPIGGAPDGSAAWRIRYRTLDKNGAPVEVTGIVIIPKGPPPAKGRDVVSWGRGTVGLAPVCAPSKTPQKMFEKTPGIQAVLARGYVITASDFADPDSNRVHPYLVGVAEGHAMLDAVRAVRTLRTASPSKHYVLWGESEGAHAALWAAKLAPTYAPDINLVGVAVAAPPSDLIANFDMIKNPGVRALMTGYVSDSWSKVYGIPLSTFSNAFGRFIIHRLSKDCTRFDVASAFTNVALLIASGQIPRDLGKPWTKPLKENSVAPWKMTVPLLVAQGGEDDVVAPSLTRKFVAGSCQLGDAVHFILKPTAGHLDIAKQTADETTAWIADRFAQKPPISDCGSVGNEATTPLPIKNVAD